MLRPGVALGVHRPRLQHPRRRRPRRARPRARRRASSASRAASASPPSTPSADRPARRTARRPTACSRSSDLSVEFLTDAGAATVVDHVSFGVDAGEVLGLVGESGSGKTVTSLAVMRLVASPPGRITGGSVDFDGPRPARRCRSRSCARCAATRSHGLPGPDDEPQPRVHHRHPARRGDPAAPHDEQVGGARTRARRAARAGGHPRPGTAPRRLPAPALGRHAPAGAARDRAVVRTRSCSSPTSRRPRSTSPSRRRSSTSCARCRRELGMAVIFVTHDLGVVADLCYRVLVMYAGQVVEEATVEELFARPRHPYTEGLLAAIPQAGTARRATRRRSPAWCPSATAMPTGCRFHPRCPYATPRVRDHPGRADRRCPTATARGASGSTSSRSRARNDRPATADTTPVATGALLSGTASRSTSRSGAASCAAPSVTCARSTASTSPSNRARPSAWSASRVRASRRSAAC